MRLSRWSRRACPSCSRCSSAVPSCKGVVCLLLYTLTKDDLEGWNGFEGPFDTRGMLEMLLPVNWIIRRVWIGQDFDIC
jgi:hypothetical protein